MRTLIDLFDECDRDLQALGEAMHRCPQPLTEAHFIPRNPDLIATLDQFAYRFAKLQDAMSTQLFRQFCMQILQEPVEMRPVIDILNLLERYNYLSSTKRWQEIREIRNQISHEYRLSTPELIVTLQIAFAMVAEMADMVAALKNKAQSG